MGNVNTIAFTKSFFKRHKFIPATSFIGGIAGWVAFVDPNANLRVYGKGATEENALLDLFQKMFEMNLV